MYVQLFCYRKISFATWSCTCKSLLPSKKLISRPVIRVLFRLGFGIGRGLQLVRVIVTVRVSKVLGSGKVYGLDKELLLG